MLYVQQSLGPDEELVHVGQFHWMYNVHAIMAIVWGVIGSIMVLAGGIYMFKQFGQIPPNADFLHSLRYLHPGMRIFSFIVFLLGLLSFAQMMVVKATTEIVVTSSRLVFKRGLVSRQVVEMSVDRVEGVNVLQSFWGRIFGYGRLAVRGMGVGEVVLPPIEDAISFRQCLEKARSMRMHERTGGGYV